MGVLSESISVYHMLACCPRRSEETVVCPGTLVTEHCELPCVCVNQT